MKVLLTSLNSKYVHTNLAIRYLKKYVEDFISVEIEEYTINQNIDLIVGEIYEKNYDMVGFSTYIWNIENTLRIAKTLKKIKPDLEILLGGPEVSYDGEDIMAKHSYIDYIIYGEGEESFRELLKRKVNKSEYKELRGLIYKEEDRIIKNKAQPLIKDLNTIASPYIQGENHFKDRVVYYESSRGCPFNCQFCLSSTIKGVRYFDMERIKEDLSTLISWNVKQVKFIDRTFNANKKHALEIMEFIVSKNTKNINFHFEISGHLIDEEMLDFLAEVDEGLFQFEIGIQSTNEKTIKAISRTTNFRKLEEVIKEISSYKKIHLHLDLIAGLPYEDIESFEESFNQVYALKAEKIQLGFLKLLKGSGLRKDANKYGYKFSNYSPYEILENNYISYYEIVKLKVIEDLVEKYYNEGYFKNTLNYIVENHYDSPFKFFEEFSYFWKKKNYHLSLHSRKNLYLRLKEFAKEKDYKGKSIIENLLKFDYLKNHKGNLPSFLYDDKVNFPQKKLHTILKNEEFLKRYLPNYYELARKDIIKRVRIEKFTANVAEIIDSQYSEKNEEIAYVLFDYVDGDINRSYHYDITKNIKELI